MIGNLNDLNAFLTVAAERSFTRAASRLGVSQSRLSRTISELETQLGVRLLHRTTRSVSLTDAGQRLLRSIGPRLDEIRAELDALADLRDRPAGTVRITASEYAAETLVWPRIAHGLMDYPDIAVEIVSDNGFVDIAALGLDAGVRLGDSIEKDMVSVPIGPDERLVPVAAPTYLSQWTTPSKPQDLVHHRCINLRLVSSGTLYAWEFEENGLPIRVRVTGPCIFSSMELVLDAALRGFGIAFVPEEAAKSHIAAGQLVLLLDRWCKAIPGYRLYYPSRRQPSAAFQVVADLLRA